MRKRLDFDRPVSREVLMECLDLALQAPTGSNARAGSGCSSRTRRRGRHWPRSTGPPRRPTSGCLPQRGDIRDQQIDAVLNSAMYLNENPEKAPVFLIPCLEGRPERMDAGTQASFWGSLLPAVGLHAGVALPRAGLGVDHAAPDR